MSKRSIILAVVAVLCFVAALFSVFTDKQVTEPEPEQDPEQQLSDIAAAISNKFEEVKVTPENDDSGTDKET